MFRDRCGKRRRPVIHNAWTEARLRPRLLGSLASFCYCRDARSAKTATAYRAMTSKALLDAWAAERAPAKTHEAYSIRLSNEDAARVHAFADLFPGVDAERIISDLLAAALEQTEAAIPYVQGDRVIREDEFGDPVYEDVGLTSRFRELVRAHRKRLET